MKKVCFFLPGFLVGSLCGNEALDLLDREAETSQNVFEHAARLPSGGKNAVVEKKTYEPADVRFPTRWRQELEPKLPFEVGGGTLVAPRGLFEYQYQDRSIARGAKLSRARLGVALSTYYGIEVVADAVFSSSGSYEGWETLKASIPVKDGMQLTLGKFAPPFSTELSRDAATRWFPTVSPLAAQLAPANSLGVMMEGDDGDLDWKLGWFGSEAGRSIPSLDGRGYLLASVASSENRGGTEELPEANYHRWHLDYLYNLDGDESESIPQGYRHLLAAGVQYSSGPFDFYSDFLWARGAANTAYGITVAGRYWLLQDAVSFVGRYQYATSRDPGGIVSPWGIPETGSYAIAPRGFPEETIAGGLTSIYGGINIHLDDDHFIIGTGLEYRSLSDVEAGDDFSSWGWNTFARYAF